MEQKLHVTDCRDQEQVEEIILERVSDQPAASNIPYIFVFSTQRAGHSSFCTWEYP